MAVGEDRARFSLIMAMNVIFTGLKESGVTHLGNEKDKTNLYLAAKLIVLNGPNTSGY